MLKKMGKFAVINIMVAILMFTLTVMIGKPMIERHKKHEETVHWIEALENTGITVVMSKDGDYVIGEYGPYDDQYIYVDIINQTIKDMTIVDYVNLIEGRGWR